MSIKITNPHFRDIPHCETRPNIIVAFLLYPSEMSALLISKDSWTTTHPIAVPWYPQWVLSIPIFVFQKISPFFSHHGTWMSPTRSRKSPKVSDHTQSLPRWWVEWDDTSLIRTRHVLEGLPVSTTIDGIIEEPVMAGTMGIVCCQLW